MERTTKVRPKKFLGQHFLHDQSIARRIVRSLEVTKEKNKVLEIGPGMGVLTKFLMEVESIELKAIEIDRDSVTYLKIHYPGLDVIEGDFLDANIGSIFPQNFSIIGNFPYNISSQIFFRILENRSLVDQVVCMLQKEVAERIAASEGSKVYGILSVLLQAYYDIDYLFKVQAGAFTPPPKVLSAVIRLKRNNIAELPCNEDLFVRVVKQGFSMRRKTLRNALKNLNLAAEISALKIMDKRAEQLSVNEFIDLTQLIDRSRGAAIG